MSSADRLVVPLNSMCSIKCEMPFCPVDSRREPEPIQMPTDTLRTCGITSVITRTPLPSVLISMFRKGLVGDVIAEERKEPIPVVAPSGSQWGLDQPGAAGRPSPPPPRPHPPACDHGGTRRPSRPDERVWCTTFMDLREFRPSPEQVNEAATLLHYQ